MLDCIVFAVAVIALYFYVSRRFKKRKPKKEVKIGLDHAREEKRYMLLSKLYQDILNDLTHQITFQYMHSNHAGIDVRMSGGLSEWFALPDDREAIEEAVENAIKAALTATELDQKRPRVDYAVGSYDHRFWIEIKC